MKFTPKTVILVVNLTILYVVSGVLANLQIDENYKFFESANLGSILKNLQSKNFLRKYTDLQKNNNTCEVDLSLYNTALQNFEPWALKMVDASSKIPSGLLEGNFVDLGMFDECIAIQGNFSTQNNRGKHCIYELKITLPGNITLEMNPKFAMCIPSTCDIENVVSIISKVNKQLHEMGIDEDFNIDVETATCSSLDFEKWTTGSIIALTVILLIIFFLVACTILELTQNWLNQKCVGSKIILTLAKFSLLNTSLRILSTKDVPGSISTIHGIRALSILWIIYGHEIHFGAITFYVNMVNFKDWLTSWKCIYLAMGIFAVDTFLMLSGFLLSFLFLKKMSKGAKFNLFEYYLHRYIRLTPAVAGLILITIFIAPHLGSGPRWEGDIVANVSGKCEESWWKFILYVQNYVGKNPSENLMCLGHLWYLSVDMQLFWLSPLILYPLAKKPKIGLTILGLLFIASIITPGIIVSKYELLFNMVALNLRKKIFETTRLVYTVTHCRASPWLFGIFFGYIMAKKNIKPKRGLLMLGWFTAISCFIFCTWGFFMFLDKNYVYNVTWETIFASLSHFIWSVGVAWIIYVCHHGYGGVINKFLSLPIFLPISRISYSLYLLHYFIQNLKVGATRLLGYFSSFTVFQTFLSDLLFCLVLSFFFCIIFESPIIILEKMLFERKRERKEPQSHIQQNKIDEFGNGNNYENKFGNKFKNPFRTGTKSRSFDELEKGKTTLDPETNEPTTDL